MRNLMIACVLVFALLFTPVATSVYAGEIASQNVTSSENAVISNVEANTASVLDIQCGGDEALAAVGIFFIVLILCAAIAASGPA